MSSMMFHGLQSFFEPSLVQPQDVGLMMIATKSHAFEPISWSQRFSVSDCDTECSNNEKDNIGSDNDKKGVISKGDIFSQNLSKGEKEKHYVHPLVKKYSCKLSERSLELCTETLGCETGSDYGDIDINSLYSSSSSSNNNKVARKSPAPYSMGSRKANYGSFPPPLTSISGSNCVNIRPHREGGRLVMQAVVVPSSQTNFQVERCDGRLTLRLLEKDNSNPFDSESVEKVKQEQETEPEPEPEPEPEQKQVEEKHEIEVADEHEIEEEHLLEGEIDEKERVEMGKLRRPRRCMEGGRSSRNKRLLIWEPCWVATS